MYARENDDNYGRPLSGVRKALQTRKSSVAADMEFEPCIFRSPEEHQTTESSCQSINIQSSDRDNNGQSCFKNTSTITLGVN